MRGRIRTIKPEVHTDEVLWDLEVRTGLPVFRGFLGLWNYADREGRFEWRPRTLKAAILPYWEGDFGAVMDALAEARFLVRYDVSGREYGMVRTFKIHQLVNKREANSQLPAPEQATHVHDTATHVHDTERHVPSNVDASTRAAVFARDESRCLRCGATEDLTVDHIFPRSIGGTHALANLRTLCRACNSARPVAGEALIADLDRDGLSMADMQRTCFPVRARAGTETHVGNGNGNQDAHASFRGRARKSNSDAIPEPETENSASPPEGDPDPEVTAEQIRTRFRALHMDRFHVDPYMGGDSVHSFPERLRNTARAQGREPLALLAEAYARWHPSPDDKIARNAPYASFAARFGSLCESVNGSNGQTDLERLQTEQIDALGRGDRERYRSLVAEERRRQGKEA